MTHFIKLEMLHRADWVPIALNVTHIQSFAPDFVHQDCTHVWFSGVNEAQSDFTVRIAFQELFDLMTPPPANWDMENRSQLNVRPGKMTYQQPAQMANAPNKNPYEP